MVSYKLNHTIKPREYTERAKDFCAEYQCDINSKLHVSNNLLYGSLLLDKEVVEEIKYATEELWRIMKTVNEAVIELEDDELVRMGYPKSIIPSMKLEYLRHDTALSRFDFILGEEGIKAIGINSVLPVLVKETFFHNQQMIEHENRMDKKMIFQKMKSEKTKSEKSKVENPKNEISKNENWKIKIPKFLKGNENKRSNFLKSPNENGLTALRESYLGALSDASRFLDVVNPKIVVAGLPYEDDKDNYEQTKFIFDNIPNNYGKTELINIKSLRVDENGVYLPNGQSVDILVVPSFHHIKHTDNEGEVILKLVEQRKIALLNPPNASVLQNKFTFYLLWNMHLNGTLSDADSIIVDKYLAPTFCTPYGADICVRKSVMGSSSFRAEMVDLVDNKRDVYNESRDTRSIYQDFFELPSIEVVIDGKFQEKKFIICSFICNSEAVGLACIIGEDNIKLKTHWLAVSHL